jgi:hypothetical protein
LLKVSDNRRCLVHDDGQPFFFLGDTAWELFHRLNRSEADRYLENRAAKGFTVIQAVVLSELDGLETPNANGDKPFPTMDIDKPNEAYFAHVDYIVDKAASLGLVVAMLPSWGCHVGVNWSGADREYLLDANNSYRFGRFLGRRYATRPIIWVLGGDRPGTGVEDVWNQMAAGIQAGDGGRGLISYHPWGGNQSSLWFHDAWWLDFNMSQSGHSPTSTNYVMIQRDYRLTPVKPCMDAEPAYEYPADDMPEKRPNDAFVVRLKGYWAIFAGAFGHTYGTHAIWQMYAPPRHPLWDIHHSWEQALDLPGAQQVVYLKNLMLSRPFLTRIPDQSLVRSGMAWGLDHVSTTRDGQPGLSNATYLMAYFPKPRRVLLNTGRIAGEKLRVWWFNPRTGCADDAGTIANTGTMEFIHPTSGEKEDWALVLDDVRANYPAPGRPG